MDYNYDEPRSAPVPTTFDENFISPTVPEVSMIFGNNYTNSQKQTAPNYLSYNAWKNHNKNSSSESFSHSLQNKENLVPHSASNNHVNTEAFDQMSISQLRKQVRFENSLLQQKIHANEFNAKSSSNEKGMNNSGFDSSPLLKNSLSNPPSNNVTESFEQIYMANVPNRHLDLSMIDTGVSNIRDKNIVPHLQIEKSAFATPDVLLQKPSIKNVCYSSEDKINSVDVNKYTKNNNFNESITPKTYKEYCEIKSCKDNILVENDVCNRKVNEICCTNCKCCVSQSSNFLYPFEPKRMVTSDKSDFRKHYVQTFAQVSTDTQTSTVFQNNDVTCNKNVHKQNCDNELTIKDLLTIIQQQNEQLLTLQKQVSLLLEKKERPKPVEAVPTLKEIEMIPDAHENIYAEKYITSTKHEAHGSHLNTPKKGPLPKFAIDVMTSFEVSIRPQQNFNLRNKYCNPVVEPKIQEITENSCDKNQETRKVLSTESDSHNSVDVSLTLNEPLPFRENCPSPEQSIHVDMQDYSTESDSDSESSSDVGWTVYNNVMGQVTNILKKNKSKYEQTNAKDKECSSNHGLDSKTSRRVKQATMKHLQRIGLNLLNTDDSVETTAGTTNSQDCTPTEVSFAVKQLLMKYLPDEHLATITHNNGNTNINVRKQNLIKNRPEFSFATVQYMKKYNLIAPKENQDFHSSKPAPTLKKTDNPNILDITALKQQPKLL